MKKIEISLISAVLFAMFLKFFFIKLSNQIFGISALILVLFYFIFSVLLLNGIAIHKISFKGISSGRIVGSMAFGFFQAAIIMGIFSKFMVQPGANQALMIGGIWIVIIGSIALIVAYSKGTLKDNFYRSIASRTIIFIVIAAISFFTSGMTLIDIYYRNHPTYRDMLKQSIRNPESVDVKALEAEEEKMK